MSMGGDNSRGFTPLRWRQLRHYFGRIDFSKTGFTIVETLIVLAVSGTLALSAILLVNGRQNKTQFQVAINNLQQQFQQIINETATGYYPNNGTTFTCTGNAGPSGEPKIIAGATAQGSNQSCIFLGKALRFGKGVAGPAGDDGTLTVYPIVGNRLDLSFAKPREVTTYPAAKPIVIAHGLATETLVPDNFTTLPLGGGLTFAKAAYDGAPWSSSTIGTIAFVGSLGSYTIDSNGNALLDSSSQQLKLYGYANSITHPWSTASSGPSVVDTIDDAGLLPTPFKSVELCFASGTTTQSGKISIGGGSGSLEVSLKIYGNTTCS